MAWVLGIIVEVLTRAVNFYFLQVLVFYDD
jgi:hypothetical protein